MIQVRKIMLIAFGYAILGYAGLVLAIPPGYASPVFPAAGFALAIILHYRHRALSAIWLGSFILNIVHVWIANSLSLVTIQSAFLIASAATAQAWIGSQLLKRWLLEKKLELETEKEAYFFMLLGGVIACLTSASISVLSLYLLGLISGSQVLFTWWNWYVGDTLGVLVFTPLVLSLVIRNNELWKERRRRMLIPLLIILGLAYSAFYSTASWENKTQLENIKSDGEVISDRISDRLLTHREVLASLRHFVEATPDFGFKQFENFTKVTLADNPDIFGMSFNDLITDKERDEFEKLMTKKSPLGDFKITERNLNKQFVKAAIRSEYVPVRYIVPLDKNKFAVGYDINSDPMRRDAIQRALAKDNMVATAPIQLVQEQKKEPGILELWPVITPSLLFPHVNTDEIGFVVAVVKLNKLVEIAINRHIPKGLAFELMDENAVSEHALIYKSDGYNAATKFLSDNNSTLSWHSHLQMGDRTWILNIVPTQEYVQQRRPWMAWGVGIAGLLFSSLLQILMLGMTGRNSITRRKNQELEASEARYLRMFNASILPMWVFDKTNQQFLMVNEAAIIHYGWSKEVFLTMSLTDIRVHDEPFLLHNDISIMSTFDQPNVIHHKRHNGSIIDVMIHSSSVEYGNHDACLQIIQDITQENKNKEQLLLAERVFENSGNGLVITDPLANAISVNPAFCKITGYSEQEIMGKNMRQLNSGRHSKSFFYDMWQSLRNNQQWQGEIWNRRKNGEVYPEWLSIHAVCGLNDVVTHYVGSFTDISELKSAQDKADFLAYHDALTHLPNLLLARDRIEQAISRAQRYNSKIAVLFMDLDKFKLINDTYGHLIGDKLLKEVALRLQSCMRKEDTLCRLSGDEFMAVLYDIHDVTVISILCERILKNIITPAHIDKLQLTTSVSIGIAIYPDDGNEDTETLLKHADTAMNEAKQAGRNTYRFFDKTMNLKMLQYVKINDELRGALKNNEFELYYQPQISLKTGRVIGAEALIRWNHPELGIKSPDYFISIAEESGLIVPIGDWVLQEACQQAMSWLSSGLYSGLVAVNLSALQFQRGSIENKIIDILQKTNLPPEHIELELTESVLIQDIDKVLSITKRLKTIGVKLSVDDFGTGYSSLSYLKQFNVDKLKIDKSFVRDIHQSSQNKAIVQAIINMAKSLNLKTIAEGVEQENELQSLMDMGCDEIQGYYYSKPLSISDFEKYISEYNNLDFTK